jgi:hypothetical protein
LNTAKKSLAIGIALLLISLTIFPSFDGKEFPNSDSSDDLPNSIWSKIYGNGKALSVQQTSDEGYILAGTTWEEAFLIKTDGNGSKEWETYYGGEYEDGAYGVIECGDGGYISTGWDQYILKDGLMQTFLFKTDEDGNELWYKTFRRNDRKGSSWGMSVIEVSDGYVILAILDYYGSTETPATWLIKTDENGNELWNRTYLDDIGYSLIQSNDGGFVITGNGAWLLKTDSEGNELWNYRYGRYVYEKGEDVIQTDDGGYIIAGSYTPAYETWHDVCLYKTDGLGNLEWIRHYGGTDQDSGYSIAKTDDGGYVIVGIRHSGLPDFTGWILKTDGNGNKLWDKVIEGSRISDVIKSNDGNYVVAGAKGGAWLAKIEDFENNMPSKPSHVYDKNSFQLKVASIDPDGDRIRYGISWYNNGVVDEWTDYFDSGEEGSINCFGKDKPAYVIAEDEHGGQSEWVMAKVKSFNPILQLLERLIDYFPLLEYFLQLIE